jgi:hypothetical protein
MTDRTTARLAALLCMAFALMSASPSHAQVCGDDDAGDEEDAGLCEDDAGAEEVDASMPLADGGAIDAGIDAGSVDVGYACSCTAHERDEQGTIHVCTGSEDRDVCASFSCTVGTVRYRPCDQEAVRLCCTMPSRGLYSQLYEDCDHPNCETGFRAQCRAFGGTVAEGACELEEHDAYEEADGGGFCSMQPSRGGARPPVWLVLMAASLGVITRRVRRRPR